MVGAGDPSRRRYLRLAAAAGIGSLAGCGKGTDRDNSPSEPNGETRTASSTADGDSRTIYVSASGSPDGDGTEANPLTSIQEAFNRAEPGEMVYVQPGEYREYILADRGGEPGAPITITGPPDAVIRPPDEEQEGLPQFRCTHNHVHLTGCTFNSLVRPEEPDELRWYGSGLDIRPRYGELDHLTDVKLMPHAIGNTRGAMIDVRRANNVEIGGFEVIGPAGVQYLLSDEEGHYGEIVYIIAPPYVPTEDSWEERYGPRDIHIHHIDNSAGHPHAELVDTGVTTRNVTIEYCTDAGGSGRHLLPGHNPTSETAVNVLGQEITVRWNVVENGHGQAIEIGWPGLLELGDEEAWGGRELSEKALDSGQNNAIYGNRLVDNDGMAIQFLTDAEEEILPRIGPDQQRVICGNEYTGDTHVQPDGPCPDWVREGNGIGHTGGEWSRQ